MGLQRLRLCIGLLGEPAHHDVVEALRILFNDPNDKNLCEHTCNNDRNENQEEIVREQPPKGYASWEEEKRLLTQEIG